MRSASNVRWLVVPRMPRYLGLETDKICRLCSRLAALLGARWRKNNSAFQKSINGGRHPVRCDQIRLVLIGFEQ
jgi:hypothetical protein